MTVKEMEEKSGMTRANIRFYETEGLLVPERRDNNYRDYSEEDLETLNRIRLLRTLHVSLEDIRALQQGEKLLDAVLEEQLKRLKAAQEDLTKARDICETMRRDKAEYCNLNAAHYLAVMQRRADSGLPALEMDEVPMVRASLRRFGARMLDGAFYMLVWNAFLMLVMRVNFAVLSTDSFFKVLNWVVPLLMMLFLEPVMLVAFKTTPGKWVLGLSVTDNCGRRLSYEEAFARTRQVLWRGMGFKIPIYYWVRLWKSMRENESGDTLEWEYGSVLELRDEKKWRIAAYFAVWASFFGALVLAEGLALMPRHRGDISVAQFCENYNSYADYYGSGNGYYLNKSGEWIKERGAGGISFTTDRTDYQLPRYIFTERDGVMIGVEFTVEIIGTSEQQWLGSYQREMVLLALSFVRAQKTCGIYSEEAEELVRTIEENPFQSFETAACGVDISCQVEYNGYDASTLFLVPNSENPRFYLHFSMEEKFP